MFTVVLILTPIVPYIVSIVYTRSNVLLVYSMYLYVKVHCCVCVYMSIV